jgi:hypothetical protein
MAFVDLLHQESGLYRDGAVREICTLEGSPNGMRLGADGALWVTFGLSGQMAPHRL